jgi:septum formation protein
VPLLVLASTSPYRRDLLSRLCLPFEVAAPGVDEAPGPGEDGAALALRLAQAKARAVAARHPGALVIGSDQTCVAGDRLLGKPGSAAAAGAQLAQLSGASAIFHTALCLLDSGSGRAWLGSTPTEVRVRPLDPDTIARYVVRDRPLDCAGGFKVESLGIALFDAVRSDDPTALVGLPLLMLCRFLREAGVVLP